MNVVIMVLWLSFVVIPEAVLTPEPISQFAERNMSDLHSIEVANICSAQYVIQDNTSSFLQNVISTLEGTVSVKRCMYIIIYTKRHKYIRGDGKCKTVYVHHHLYKTS